MGKAEIREIRTLTKQIWKYFPANSEPVRLLEAILKICEYLDSRPTMELCAEVEEACGAEDSHVTNVAMLIPSLEGLKEEMERGNMILNTARNSRALWGSCLGALLIF